VPTAVGSGDWLGSVIISSKISSPSQCCKDVRDADQKHYKKQCERILKSAEIREQDENSWHSNKDGNNEKALCLDERITSKLALAMRTPKPNRKRSKCNRPKSNLLGA